MTKLLFAAVVCVAVLSLFVDQGEAACCSCEMHHKFCPDHTPCTPCCAYHPCNIFCCNCDRCRGVVIGKIQADDASGFQEIDLDGDGFVDRGEAQAHLKSGRCGNYSEKINSFDKSFKLLDKDGDDKLTYAEIDSKL